MSPFEAAILATLQKQPVYKDDKKPEFAEAKATQLEQAALAIAKASRKPKLPISQRDLASLLIMVAGRETHFSLRIARGECLAWECDRGRARGPWQQHQDNFTRPIWDQLHGLAYIDVQAQSAADALARGYWTCNPQRTGVNDWVMATINGYAGHRCGEVWDGLKLRMSDYVKIRRQLG
jgi:hypothetical protein